MGHILCIVTEGTPFCTFSAKTELNSGCHRERRGRHIYLLFLNLPSWVSLLEHLIFRQPLTPVRQHFPLWPLVHESVVVDGLFLCRISNR